MTATWTANRTWTAGELVTAAIMNTYIRDNLDWLKKPTESGNITFSSDFTTTSASFVDVTGQTTTLTTNGGGLDVFIRYTVQSSSSSTSAQFQLVVDGSTNIILSSFSSGITLRNNYTTYHHIPALSAGSHTVKVQALISGGATLTIRGTASTDNPAFYVREAGS